MECQKQRWSCWDDPCSLCREAGQIIPSWETWEQEFQQLWYSRTCPCLCSTSDHKSPSLCIQYTWSSDQPSAINTEWTGLCQSYSKKSTMCLWQDCLGFRGWGHCEGYKDEYKWSVGRWSQWQKRALPFHACQNNWPSKSRWKWVIPVAQLTLLLHFSGYDKHHLRWGWRLLMAHC